MLKQVIAVVPSPFGAQPLVPPDVPVVWIVQGNICYVSKPSDETELLALHFWLQNRGLSGYFPNVPNDTKVNSYVFLG